MIVVVTLAEVRSLPVLPRFLSHASRCVAAARATPGNRGVRVEVRGALSWGTLSFWDDERAIRAFFGGRAHREAMRHTRALTRRNRFGRLVTGRPPSSISWAAAARTLAP